MPDVSCFMQQHIAMLRKAFGQRLLYVGLQGGYARGDACAQSDFDVMIVLDMDKDALIAWDASPLHHQWKDEYGALLEKKAIFDHE